MSTYFEKTGFVSNSDLGYLNEALKVRESRDPQAAYKFGTLIDALITEPHRVDHDQRKVDDLTFTETEWSKAEAMQRAGAQDNVLKLLCAACDFQSEIYWENFSVTYEGLTFEIPAKCKLDFHNSRARIGGDLKSTICTSQKSFEEAIKQVFDYDRQASWYMDVGALDAFIFVGISKVAIRGVHRVFKYAIQKGSDDYYIGKSKYSRLAYYYKHLILNQE